MHIVAVASWNVYCTFVIPGSVANRGSPTVIKVAGIN